MVAEVDVTEIENYEEEEDMAVIEATKVELDKPLRIRENDDQNGMYKVTVEERSPGVLMIYVKEPHYGPDGQYYSDGAEWSFNLTGIPREFPDANFILENYVPIDFNQPIRIAAHPDIPQDIIEDIEVIRFDESDHTTKVRVNVAHRISVNDEHEYHARSEWWFTPDGYHLDAEPDVADLYIRVENYTPAAAEPKPINLEKPIRVKATSWQRAIDEIILKSQPLPDMVTLRIVPKHRTHEDGEEHEDTDWDFYVTDGRWCGGDETYIELENYDPEEVVITGSSAVDPSKPIRIKKEDWQDAIYDVTVGATYTDEISLRINVKHFVNKLNADANYASEPRSWHFNLSDGIFSGSQPTDGYIRIENYDPNDVTTTTATKGTTTMPTADAETKEKASWNYPTGKKWDLDEDTLLVRLRRLVQKNKVPAWHLTRIKKDGFKAKRFEIDLRKPVMFLEYSKRKTQELTNVTRISEEGEFQARFTKEGKITRDTTISSGNHNFHPNGLYYGEEEVPHFGAFNADILVIYELTMESESSLTQLLAAIYGDD